MKKYLILVLAVLAVLLLASCMTVSSFDRLYVGMSRAEVLSLYGNPDSRGYDQSQQTDYYVYYVSSSVWATDNVDFRVDFRNDKVVSWGQIGHSLAPVTEVIYVNK